MEEEEKLLRITEALMAREMAKSLCDDVKPEERMKCISALMKLLLFGSGELGKKGLEELKGLSEESKSALVERVYDELGLELPL